VVFSPAGCTPGLLSFPKNRRGGRVAIKKFLAVFADDSNFTGWGASLSFRNIFTKGGFRVLGHLVFEFAANAAPRSFPSDGTGLDGHVLPPTLLSPPAIELARRAPPTRTRTNRSKVLSLFLPEAMTHWQPEALFFFFFFCATKRCTMTCCPIYRTRGPFPLFFFSLRSLVCGFFFFSRVFFCSRDHGSFLPLLQWASERVVPPSLFIEKL